MKYYLGIDIGSVTLKIVICDENGDVQDVIINRTHGDLFATLQKSLASIYKEKYEIIDGVGATGSARVLIGQIIGADIIKNEITAQWKAVSHIVPDVKTIIEIGGQDSKLIRLEKGIMTDFAMNTVCAAGTGSFLDQQANRLQLSIEQISNIALTSQKASNITGRCTIFAESDMIQKQQVGESIADILHGLCDTLARNYINNLAKDAALLSPITFVGGVAANKAIVRSFEKILHDKIIVPREHAYTGAYGMALLAKEQHIKKSKFPGWNIKDEKFETEYFTCKDCDNNCQIVKIKSGGKILGHLGSRCQKYL